VTKALIVIGVSLVFFNLVPLLIYDYNQSGSIWRATSAPRSASSQYYNASDCRDD
jgi:hypothetical protein